MTDKDEPLSCPEGGFTGFANESGSADGELESFPGSSPKTGRDIGKGQAGA